jgi:hypothetical protein
MRDLYATRYAINDFGYSLLYPYDTVLEDVKKTRSVNFDLRGNCKALGERFV